jgi:hypothetical protein
MSGLHRSPTANTGARNFHIDFPRAALRRRDKGGIATSFHTAQATSISRRR